MDSVKDVLADKRENGKTPITLGNPAQGCPFCGEVAIKYGQDGKAILYHPALNCCAARSIQEAIWRFEETRRIEEAMQALSDALQKHLDEVEAAIQDNDHKRANALRAQTRRVRAGTDNKMKALKARQNGHPDDADDPGIVGELNEQQHHLSQYRVSIDELKAARDAAIKQQGGITPDVLSSVNAMLNKIARQAQR